MSKTALYRAFGSDGTLLYVGISRNAISRFQSHADTSTWFENLSQITIEWFGSTEEAAAAEFAAIKVERPRFNVAYNQKPAAKPVRQPKEPGKRTRHRLPMPPPEGAVMGPYLLTACMKGWRPEMCEEWWLMDTTKITADWYRKNDIEPTQEWFEVHPELAHLFPEVNFNGGSRNGSASP